jgi:hypothetical protein
MVKISKPDIEIARSGRCVSEIAQDTLGSHAKSPGAAPGDGSARVSSANAQDFTNAARLGLADVGNAAKDTSRFTPTTDTQSEARAGSANAACEARKHHEAWHPRAAKVA